MVRYGEPPARSSQEITSQEEMSPEGMELRKLYAEELLGVYPKKGWVKTWKIHENPHLKMDALVRCTTILDILGHLHILIVHEHSLFLVCRIGI